MWKRFGGASYPFFIVLLIILFWIVAAGAVLAACGSGPEPPAPPEGFAWPVSGEISQPWSLDCQTDRGHRGIDISAGSGAPVKASASGMVSFVGYTPAEGGGTTVTIDHAGGLRSTYLHLSEAGVAKGQQVGQGESIGLTDDLPLHFGIKLVDRSRDVYYNPEELLPPLGASDPKTQPESGTGPENAAAAGQVIAKPPAQQATPVPEVSTTPIEAPLPERPLSIPSPETPTVDLLKGDKIRLPDSPLVRVPAAGAGALKLELPKQTDMYLTRAPKAGGTAAWFKSGDRGRRASIAFGILLISVAAISGRRISFGDKKAGTRHV